uniref:Ubiquitin-associated protein 2-like n=1 Tax=Callorhinchus milii TaxID=7868 RepID=A0A4W3GM09_CALMI
LTLLLSCSETSSTISSNPSQDLGYQPSSIAPSAFTVQSSAQGTQYDPSSNQRAPYCNSLSSSPQKDLTQAKNGFSAIQTSQAIEGGSCFVGISLSLISTYPTALLALLGKLNPPVTICLKTYLLFPPPSTVNWQAGLQPLWNSIPQSLHLTPALSSFKTL